MLAALARRKKRLFGRRVSIGDILTERAENAAAYGFGEGTTMYDNVLVLGDVVIGDNTWIGPGCILDGSGGCLRIGKSPAGGTKVTASVPIERDVAPPPEAPALR